MEYSKEDLRKSILEGFKITFEIESKKSSGNLANVIFQDNFVEWLKR